MMFCAEFEVLKEELAGNCVRDANLSNMTWVNENPFCNGSIHAATVAPESAKRECEPLALLSWTSLRRTCKGHGMSRYPAPIVKLVKGPLTRAELYPPTMSSPSAA